MEYVKVGVVGTPFLFGKSARAPNLEVRPRFFISNSSLKALVTTHELYRIDVRIQEKNSKSVY